MIPDRGKSIVSDDSPECCVGAKARNYFFCFSSTQGVIERLVRCVLATVRDGIDRDELEGVALSNRRRSVRGCRDLRSVCALRSRAVRDSALA